MFPSQSALKGFDKPKSWCLLIFASQPHHGLISLFSLISLKHSLAAQSFKKKKRTQISHLLT